MVVFCPASGQQHLGTQGHAIAGVSLAVTSAAGDRDVRVDVKVSDTAARDHCAAVGMPLYQNELLSVILLDERRLLYGQHEAGILDVLQVWSQARVEESYTATG
jgi:hypothetical protein